MNKLSILLEEVKLLKDKLSKLKPLSKGEIKRLQEDFAVMHTYNSNAIEGSTVTIDETYLILEKGVTVGGKSVKEHLKTVGYGEAFYYVNDLAKKRITLTKSVIKAIHSLVLMNDRYNKGQYRNVSVMVGKHTPPEPDLVQELMQNLVANYNTKTNKITIETVALFHLEFENIHPFIDGNGRTGRLIMNLELIKNGYLPVDIKFTDRDKYYECFRNYNQTKDAAGMVELIATYEKEELRRYIDMIEYIESIEKDRLPSSDKFQSH